MPVAIVGDYAAYECPVTGKMIEGRRAHEENLKRTGSRLLEPGERQAAIKYQKEADKALENKVADTLEREFYKLTPSQRESVAKEVNAGVDLNLTRNANGS